MVLALSPWAAAAEEAPPAAPPGARDGIPVGGEATHTNEPAPATSPRSAAADAPVERYFGRGVFEAVQDAVVATPRACTISDRGLTALVLAPVFKESSAATSRGSEPSPMTLSRYDEWSGQYPPPDTNRNSNYGLYAFADPSTPYPRAFWHPGIGIWQYDSAGVGAPFTAAERVDVRTLAAEVAAGMAGRYCAATGTDQARRYAAWAPWGNPCTLCEDAFDDMYSTNFGNLTLTAGVSATGGMQLRTCELSGVAGTFPCHYIDPARAEGATWWTGSPSGGSPRSGMTPLSTPFYVFKRDGFEERHWLSRDSGYDIDITARRRLAKNARPRQGQAGSGLEWSVGSTLCDRSLSTDKCAADTTRPARPQDLTASSGAGRVSLNWSDNDESDLVGYGVYRRTPDTNYALISKTSSSSYLDTSVRGGETYYYRVKAYDTSGNWSYWSTNYATGRPTVAAYAQIVDNADRERFAASASWGRGTWNTQRQGADYRYAEPKATSDSARFRLRVPHSGRYEVYAWHPSGRSYSAGAPIGVRTSEGMRWKRVDQRSGGGRWVSLGVHPLAAGDRELVFVSRWTSAPGYVIADAVRIAER